MKIKTVAYSALANLGSYQNEEITMKAEVDSEDESPEAVIEHLRNRVKALCPPSFSQSQDKLWKLQDAIKTAERKLRQCEEQWNATTEFLRAQGIKADAPNFPQFINLLPSVKETVIEGEYEDGEDGEYDDIPL